LIEPHSGKRQFDWRERHYGEFSALLIFSFLGQASMPRILVTGGAGFLGQHLVSRLVQAGCEVTVLDLHRPRDVLFDLDRSCRRVHYGVDITQPEALRGHFQRIEVVYHLAGRVSFWRKDRAALYRTNVLGTRHVLDEAIRSRVSRFVHVSSVAAIGYTGDKDRLADEYLPFDWSKVAHKGYMHSKHLAEQEVWQACRKGLWAVVANPGLMWGPGDRLNSLPLFASLRANALPAYPPGGTNIVDVRDVARGLTALLDRGNPGQRYILGGENRTFREIFQVIADILHVAAPTRSLSTRLRPLFYYATLLNELLARSRPRLTSDQLDSSYLYRYFSSAKAERVLGWKLRYSLPETMHDVAEWLKIHAKLAA
jgi:dihydroflavonol-4-reductase